MLLNRLVNLLHQRNRLGESGDNTLIVFEVIEGERAAFAVLEPFVADLVAADMEIPHLRRHALKILCFVDVDAPPFWLVRRLQVLDLLHHVIAIDGKGHGQLAELFHQMQADQSLTEFAERAEQVNIGGQGQTGEIYLEELGIARAIGRRMKDGVHVMEHILRPERLLQIALAIRHKLQIELAGDIRDEGWREVGTTTAGSG